jgi:hypothetical protein
MSSDVLPNNDKTVFVVLLGNRLGRFGFHRVFKPSLHRHRVGGGDKLSNVLGVYFSHVREILGHGKKYLSH